ncbi:MAG: hypothetical protein ACI9VO_001844, partial [Colwellia sp.]
RKKLVEGTRLTNSQLLGLRVTPTWRILTSISGQ